mgnify:FL=1
MRSEIMNALLLRERANQRMKMEKWIDYKEGSLIPRGKQGHELRDNEISISNMGSEYSHVQVVNGL